MICMLMVYFFYVVFFIIFKEITSKNFEEFLNFLGDKITLKGWKHFGGGLDIKSKFLQ